MPDDAYSLALRLLACLTDRPELYTAVAKVARVLAPCRHSVDFASVVWNGQSYSFTATQSVIVRLLWKAWKNGTPAMRQETLLEAACSGGNRLMHIFRDHPAWGAMIVAGPAKGTFQLRVTNPPDSSQ